MLEKAGWFESHIVGRTILELGIYPFFKTPKNLIESGDGRNSKKAKGSQAKLIPSITGTSFNSKGFKISKLTEPAIAPLILHMEQSHLLGFSRQLSRCNSKTTALQWDEALWILLIFKKEDHLSSVHLIFANLPTFL